MCWITVVVDSYKLVSVVLLVILRGCRILAPESWRPRTPPFHIRNATASLVHANEVENGLA